MKNVILFYLLFIFAGTQAQKPGMDIFVRLPQVVDYNFNNKQISFTPVVSAGFTVHYKTMFADFGSFIDKSDAFGHYSYFGSTLYTQRYSDNRLFIVNSFGEVTFIPDQESIKQTTVKTLGVSPVLVWPVANSAVALAFTCGIAFAERTTSLNSRIILNYSLPLTNRP